MKTITEILGKVRPTVEGVFNSEKEYDIISIVNDNIATYISKCAVPKNTDLHDTNYWMQIASSGDLNDYVKLIEDRLNKEIAIIENTANESKRESSRAIIIADNAVKTTNEVTKDIPDIKKFIKELETNLESTTYIATNALNEAQNSIKLSEKGVPGGIPILDNSGKVPQSQLPLTKTELIDSYESNSKDKAPTADALRRAVENHGKDITTIRVQLDAIMDLINSGGGGTEKSLGVSPLIVNLNSLAQETSIEIISTTTWKITELPDWITVDFSTGDKNKTVNLTVTANSDTGNDRSIKFKVSTTDDSIVREITVTQLKAVTTYEYNVSVEPKTLNIPAAPGSTSLNVTCKKTPYINGVSTGEAVDTNFVATAENDWITFEPNYNTRTLTVNYSVNELEAIRENIITITPEDERGKTKIATVTVTQAKADSKISYNLTITPDYNGIITNDGTEKIYSLTVASKKISVANGEEIISDMPYIVRYSGDVNNSWCLFDNIANTLTLKFNETDTARTGSIIFDQNVQDGKILSLSINQAKPSIETEYVLEYEPTTINASYSSSQHVVVINKSYSEEKINGILTGNKTEIPVTFIDNSVEGNSKVKYTFTSGTNSEGKQIVTIDIEENRETITKTGNIKIIQNGNPNTNSGINISQAAGTLMFTYNLEVSCNPTTVEARNGSTILSVVSNKQRYINGAVDGPPIVVDWHATSKLNLITGSDENNSTWTMKENTVESSRNDIISVTQLEEGGLTKEVTVTQKAASIRWDYAFDSNLLSLTFDKIGQTINLDIRSTKQQYINDVRIGNPVSVLYNSSVTGEFKINGNSISIGENTTTSSKRGTATFTQSESNKTISVSLAQNAGTLTYEYEFSVSPSSLSFPANGGSQALAPNSFRYELMNGKRTGNVSEPSVSYSVSGSGFRNNPNEPYEIIADPTNTTSQRTGSVMCTQGESNKTFSVSLSQTGGTITEDYNVEATPNQFTYENSNGTWNGRSSNITCQKRKKIGNNIIEVTNVSFGVALNSNDSPSNSVRVPIKGGLNVVANLSIFINTNNNTVYWDSFENFPSSYGAGRFYVKPMEIGSSDSYWFPIGINVI